MLESMTGVVQLRSSLGALDVTFYLRSINSKNLEYNINCLPLLRDLEEQMIRILRAQLLRGRVEVVVSAANTVRDVVLDKVLLEKYKALLGELTEREGVADARLALGFLQLPGLLSVQEVLPSDFKKKEFLREFEQAVLNLKQSRLREGQKIERLFLKCLKRIHASLVRIRKRFERYRAGQLVSFKKETAAALADSRNLDSLAPAFLEWFDRFSVTEEIDRLEMHGTEALKLLGLERMQGKQLEFYFQEMQRETSTIAAKVRDFTIRKWVIEMKTDIETMKEQVRNLC